MDLYKIFSVGRLLQQALRRRVLYPAELRGLERYEVYEKSFFTSTDFDDRDIRRRVLYPTELLGLIQKI